MKALTPQQRKEADEALERVTAAAITCVINEGVSPREALDRHLHAVAVEYPAVYLRIKRRLRELAELAL
jgi:hypothetical protein